MTTTEAIDRRRHLFPTLNAGAYFLSHSLGPVPITAEVAMRRYLREWAHHASENDWVALTIMFKTA